MKQSNGFIAAVFAVGFTLSLATQAVAADVSPSESPVCEEGLAGFRKNVHELLKSRCIECHDESGSGPTHTVLDPKQSYLKVLKYVDFANIQRSKFVTKGGNGHCRDNDGSPDCGASPEELQAAIQAWWNEGERTCVAQSSPGALTTKALPLPAELPSTEDEFVPMEWNLGEVRPALKDIIFKVWVQQYSKPSSTTRETYRFRGPKIYSKVPLSGQSFEVKGIRILVNGVLDPLADSYSRLHVHTDDQNAVPFLLSTRDLVVLAGQGSQNDQISVTFEEIDLQSQVECRDLEHFKTALSTTQELCSSCHMGAGERATQAWDLRGAPEQICLRYLTRINKDFVTRSPLVQLNLGYNGHLDSGEIKDILEEIRKWLKKEPAINAY